MCFLTTFPFLCRVLLYVSPFVLTLPVLPLCGLLVLSGSLIAPDPVSCFIYSYSTVMYLYMAFSFTMKMVAAGFSETLVRICQTTPCHISEDYNLEFHCLENLNLYMTGNICHCLCRAAVLSASVFLLTNLLYC